MGIFTLNAFTTTHYSISSLLHSQFNTPNPFPTSCRASLEGLINPSFLILKPQFARIGYAPQSLITTNPKALLKGKSEGGTVKSGESKVLPHYTQNRFEVNKGFLHQDSKKGIDLHGDTLKSVFVIVTTLSISAITKWMRICLVTKGRE